MDLVGAIVVQSLPVTTRIEGAPEASHGLCAGGARIGITGQCQDLSCLAFLASPLPDYGCGLWWGLLAHGLETLVQEVGFRDPLHRQRPYVGPLMDEMFATAQLAQSTRSTANA